MEGDSLKINYLTIYTNCIYWIVCNSNEIKSSSVKYKNKKSNSSLNYSIKRIPNNCIKSSSEAINVYYILWLLKGTASVKQENDLSETAWYLIIEYTQVLWLEYIVRRLILFHLCFFNNLKLTNGICYWYLKERMCTPFFLMAEENRWIPEMLSCQNHLGESRQEHQQSHEQSVKHSLPEIHLLEPNGWDHSNIYNTDCWTESQAKTPEREDKHYFKC